MNNRVVSYQIYLKYKTILDLLDGKRMTVKEISKITDYPQSSVYKTIKDMKTVGLVVDSKCRLNDNGHPEHIYAVANDSHSSYKVRWGKCGDHESLEEGFTSLPEAEEFYKKTKEQDDIWIELASVIQSSYCQEGGR